MRAHRRFILSVVAATLATGAWLAAQSTPVPQPFPGSSSASPSKPSTPAPEAPRPQAPAVAPAAPQARTTPAPAAPAASTGPATPIVNVPMYPNAEYLETIDAGAGQKYVIYGTNVVFADLVTFYRTALKTGGRELFRTPATHQFDLGRFQDDRMAYPPSVVIKDYTWNGSPGYLFVSGTSEKRFKTIIQVVAAAPAP